MSLAPRLTQAGLLAALLSLVAVSCGSDLVELLPPSAAGVGGGTAGNDGKGGVESAGTGSGARGGEAGSTTHQGGFGGAAQSGSNTGAAGGGGCLGFACPSAGQYSGGGSLGNPNCNGGTCVQCSNDSQCDPGQRCSRFLNGICVQCTDKGQCKAGYSCDRLVGRCGPSCTDTSDCENGRVCDTAQGTCVPCIDGSACQNDFDPNTRVCYMRRCVQCVFSTDCPSGDYDVCNDDFVCVQCTSDQDCRDNENGKEHCDVQRGHCE